MPTLAHRIFRNLFTVLVLPCLSLQGQVVSADSTRPITGIAISYHSCRIIQHSNKLSDSFKEARPWMLEGQVSWHLRSENVFNQMHSFPRTGFSFYYIDLDMPDILGRSLATVAYIEPVIRPDKKFQISGKFGIGPAWMSKIYNETTNPDNLFFSTRISFMLQLDLNASLQITDHLTFSSGVQYNHISNGGISEPNLGMNFPSLKAGMRYQKQKLRFPVYNPKQESYFEKKNLIQLVTGVSAKPASWEFKKQIYTVITMRLLYSRILNRTISLSGGPEWEHDWSLIALAEQLNLQNPDGSDPAPDRINLLAGTGWSFGKFLFTQHFGVYIYSPVIAKHPIYQRYSLSYEFMKGFSAGISVKAHAQDADYTDVNVSFSF